MNQQNYIKLVFPIKLQIILHDEVINVFFTDGNS